MDDVRLVFTASRSWFGRLVRKLTRSPVSHVYLEFPIWHRQMAAEATVGGTRIVIAEKARHDVVVQFRCNFPVRAGLKEVIKTLGTVYDYGGLFLLAWWRILTQWLRLKLGAPRWRTKGVKCSELVVLFLRACHTPGVEDFDDIELVTPEDVRVFCLTNPGLFSRGS